MSAHQLQVGPVALFLITIVHYVAAAYLVSDSQYASLDLNGHILLGMILSVCTLGYPSIMVATATPAKLAPLLITALNIAVIESVLSENPTSLEAPIRAFLQVFAPVFTVGLYHMYFRACGLESPLRPLIVLFRTVLVAVLEAVAKSLQAFADFLQVFEDFLQSFADSSPAPDEQLGPEASSTQPEEVSKEGSADPLPAYDVAKADGITRSEKFDGHDIV